MSENRNSRSNIAGVILAAGAARRFGGSRTKMLAAWNDKPLIETVIDTVLSVPVEKILVVTGYQADQLNEELDKYVGRRSDVRFPKITTMENTAWNSGLTSSLQRAVAECDETIDGIVVFLGDMPCVPVALARQVIDRLDQGAPAVLPSFQGLPAHPVGIAKSLFPVIKAMGSDASVRPLLQKADGAMTLETEDEGSVFDIDSQSDLDRPLQHRS